MEYMLILAAAPEAWADAESTDDDGVFDDWELYTRALHDAGVLRGGHALHGNDAATTIRVRTGERLVTDGPFTDAKEHLLGYYLIETVDLDEALRWAARAPNARAGSIEVRPLVAGSHVSRITAPE